MANHKSAAKRARQSIKKTAVNGNRKSSVRTFEKKLLKALSDKNLKEVPELLKAYTSQMAKAVQKGVFKKGTGSRKIGRISARVSALLGAK